MDIRISLLWSAKCTVQTGPTRKMWIDILSHWEFRAECSVKVVRLGGFKIAPSLSRYLQRANVTCFFTNIKHEELSVVEHEIH